MIFEFHRPIMGGCGLIGNLFVEQCCRAGKGGSHSSVWAIPRQGKACSIPSLRSSFTQTFNSYCHIDFLNNNKIGAY